MARAMLLNPSPALPPTPAASRSPSQSSQPPSHETRPANLKQAAGTQPAVPFADICTLSQERLSELQLHYNRRSIPLIPEDEFAKLVAEEVDNAVRAGGDVDVEARVGRRLREDVRRAERELERVKMDM